MRLHEIISSSLLVSALLLASSCTAITDPGRFQFAECQALDPADVTVRLEDFGEYEDDRVEVRVMNDNTLLLRGVVEGIDDEGTMPASGPVADNTELLCLRFPDLGEAGDNLDVRVYVDLDRDDEFDPVNDRGEDLEPGWQVPVTSGLARVNATNDTPTGFDEPLDGPGDQPFEMALTGMSPHVTGLQHFAAMIIDVETDSAVGFYRLADIIDADFTVTVQAITQPGRTYRIEFYADIVANGVYDSPEAMGDHAWIEEFTAGADGVEGAFAHAPPFVPLDAFD